jgi:hypothetical protein
VSSSLSNMSIHDKKRGRRMSLFRRSASESTMMEDKKKTYRILRVLDDDDDEDVKSKTNNMPSVPVPNLRRGQYVSVASSIPTKITSVGPGSLSRQKKCSAAFIKWNDCIPQGHGCSTCR